MKARVLTAAILIAIGAAPLHAELKYTLRMDVKKSTAPKPAKPDPNLAALGVLVVDMILPGGSVELNVLTGERGTRLEANKSLAGVPAGAAVLVRPDGSMIGIDPTSKTYWRMPASETGAISAKTRRTGDFSTVGGERVERVTFQFDLPLGGAVKTPSPIVLDGEAWVAERFKKYTSAKFSGMTGALSLFQLADLGLSMRQVIRGSIFGEREIEVMVSNVSEAPAAASLFEVPAGFKEVAGPGKIGG